MIKTKLSTLCVCLIALSALTACSKTATSFSQSYRNPGYEETVFKNVLVIAIARDQDGRQAFEDALVSAVANEGGSIPARRVHWRFATRRATDRGPAARGN